MKYNFLTSFFQIELQYWLNLNYLFIKKNCFLSKNKVNKKLIYYQYSNIIRESNFYYFLFNK